MKHNNIVKLEESFYTEGKNELIIVMEFCQHGDLNHWL